MARPELLPGVSERDDPMWRTAGQGSGHGSGLAWAQPLSRRQRSMGWLATFGLLAFCGWMAMKWLGLWGRPLLPGFQELIGTVLAMTLATLAYQLIILMRGRTSPVDSPMLTGIGCIGLGALAVTVARLAAREVEPGGQVVLGFAAGGLLITAAAAGVLGIIEQQQMRMQSRLDDVERQMENQAALLDALQDDVLRVSESRDDVGRDVARDDDATRRKSSEAPPPDSTRET